MIRTMRFELGHNSVLNLDLKHQVPNNTVVFLDYTDCRGDRLFRVRRCVGGNKKLLQRNTLKSQEIDMSGRRTLVFTCVIHGRPLGEHTEHAIFYV